MSLLPTFCKDLCLFSDFLDLATTLYTLSDSLNSLPSAGAACLWNCCAVIIDGTLAQPRSWLESKLKLWPCGPGSNYAELLLHFQTWMACRLVGCGIWLPEHVLRAGQCNLEVCVSHLFMEWNSPVERGRKESQGNKMPPKVLYHNALLCSFSYLIFSLHLTSLGWHSLNNVSGL